LRAKIKEECALIDLCPSIVLNAGEKLAVVWDTRGDSITYRPEKRFAMRDKFLLLFIFFLFIFLN
jgi:hypothetical protein